MKNKVFGRKLNRSRKSRNALLRSLMRAMVEHSEITTSFYKAKFLQPDAEKIMTLVKKGDLASRRIVMSKLGNDRKTVEKLFGDLARMTKSRGSGFTRITKLPKRKGDFAQMARLEWTEKAPEKKK